LIKCTGVIPIRGYTFWLNHLKYSALMFVGARRESDRLLKAKKLGSPYYLRKVGAVPKYSLTINPGSAALAEYLTR